MNVIWPRSKANIEILIPGPFFFLIGASKGACFLAPSEDLASNTERIQRSNRDKESQEFCLGNQNMPNKNP